MSVKDKMHFIRISALVFFLFCLGLIAGCAKEPHAIITPQMNVEPQFMVRVLLLDDIKTCIVTSASALEILDSKTQSPLAWFKKADLPLAARVSQNETEPY